MEYNYFVDLSNPFLIVYLVMVVLGTSVNSAIVWLDTRKDNIKAKIKAIHSLGDEAKKLFPASKVEKSLRYDAEWNNFSEMRGGIVSAIASTCMLFGVIPFSIQFFLHIFPGLSVVWATVFSSIFFFAVSTLVGIPLEYYSTFKLDGKYGFNNSTVGTFAADTVKSFLIGTATIVAVKHLLNFGLVKFGNLSVVNILALSAGIFLSVKVFECLYTNFVMPMFNRFSPVPKKALAEKILKLCRECGFNAKQVVVMDESRRSSRPNAFIYGIFRKKIVLFDTLLENFSDDEIVSVVAHEIGHAKCHHLLKMEIESAFSTILTTTLALVMVKCVGLYHAFGYSWVTQENLTENLIVGFPIALGMISACTWFLSPIMSSHSRKMEYQADEFATKMVGKDVMKTCELRLFSQNLSDPFPDPVYEAWNYSHPSLLKRISAIDAVPDELCPKPRRRRVSAKKTAEKKPLQKTRVSKSTKGKRNGKKKAE